MRKNLIYTGILTAVVGMSSCTKINNSEITTAESNYVTTFIAEDVQTKTSYHENIGISFDTDEQMRVFVWTGVTEAKVTNPAMRKAGTPSTITVSYTAPAGKHEFAFVYPMNDNAMLDISSSTIKNLKLSDIQRPEENTFDKSQDFIISQKISKDSESTDLQSVGFKRLFTFFRLRLDPANGWDTSWGKLKSVKLTSPQSRLTGEFTIPVSEIFSEVVPTFASTTDNVTAEYSTPLSVDTPKDVWFVLNPSDLHGLTIEILTENKKITQTITESHIINILPNKINEITFKNIPEITKIEPIEKPQILDIQAVKALPLGMIASNTAVKGTVVADGNKTANLPDNVFILQDNAGQAIMLKSSDALVLPGLDSEITLLLDGCQVKEASEGHFLYHFIDNVTKSNIVGMQATNFVIPEKHIADLTNAMVFSMVKLLDIEIASPHGAFTNFKTCDPDIHSESMYYVNQYPAYYRYYPTCIRDINGNDTYMMTSIHADYAHETLPKGSGTLTGLVTKVQLSNFDISEDKLCITPVKRSDICMDSVVNNVSDILVEWDCACPNEWMNENGDFKVDNYKYRPTGGREEFKTTAYLNHSGNDAFGRWYARWRLGFQDEFRGDVNVDNTDGTNGRVTAGAINSQEWWHKKSLYVSGISTIGVTGELSLQIEMNASCDNEANMAIAYQIGAADAEDRDHDIVIPGTEFKVLRQFERGDNPDLQGSTFIPGFKVYNFRLPEELKNHDNIYVKVKLPEYSNWVGIRLAHISIKENK